MLGRFSAIAAGVMLDYGKLKSWKIPDTRQTYSDKDTILYALGIGCGGLPVAQGDLRYVYEDGLHAFPSMALVLGYPGFWLQNAEVGLDSSRLLHGEETMRLFAPLPSMGAVTGVTRVAEIYDKGPGKDAVLVIERNVFDDASGVLLATLTSTLVLRGGGGFGGPPGPPTRPAAAPASPAHYMLDLPTLTQSALIYRLSGDLNPLHADPAVAAAAGFPHPILHGLCTLGMATRAIVRTCFSESHGQLHQLGARFSAPVFPGETIRVEIWNDDGQGRFRCRSLERDAAVLTNGFFSGQRARPGIALQQP